MPCALPSCAFRAASSETECSSSSLPRAHVALSLSPFCSGLIDVCAVACLSLSLFCSFAPARSIAYPTHFKPTHCETAAAALRENSTSSTIPLLHCYICCYILDKLQQQRLLYRLLKYSLLRHLLDMTNIIIIMSRYGKIKDYLIIGFFLSSLNIVKYFWSNTYY